MQSETDASDASPADDAVAAPVTRRLTGVYGRVLGLSFLISSVAGAAYFLTVRHLGPSGVPVAGYPVPGPLDVVTNPDVGAVDEDLRTACLAAVSCDPGACRRHAESFTWSRCAQQFLATLRPIPRSIWQPLRRRVMPDAAAS